jgi:hypothetical protein
MRRLPQSTAYTVMLKLFLSSDHVSAATGKTVAIKISKAGGAFADPNAGASNATEVSNGWYKFALDTTDTNTLGDLVVRGTAASCDDAEQVCQVVKATNGGLTALPDAVAGASGGLPLSVDASGRVDVLKINGTSQTARDVGASVLLSAGTGTGQLDFTSGVVKANLAQILGTALTETAGQIAAGFKKFFNIATPAATMDHLVLVDTVTTYTGNTPQTGDAFARIGAAGAGLTALGDTRIAHLDADVSTRSTYAGADTSGTTTLLSRLTSTRAGLLDHLDADISSRMATFSYTAPLDAAGTRAALGMASANLDTQIAALATAAALSDLSDGISASFTALQSHGDSAWATATGFSTLGSSDVSAAVWDVAMADHLGAGTTGDAIFQAGVHAPSADSKADTILADIAALNNLSAADVKTQADQALADAGVTTARMSHLDADVSSRASQPSVDGLAIPTAADNADAVLAATYEGSETVQDHFRLARAALYGKANGLGGSTVHFRDAADSKNRLTASVDSDGNRAAVTTDAS